MGILPKYKEVNFRLCGTVGRITDFLEIKEATHRSRNSAEAEYRSMAAAVSEVIWLVDLLKGLGVSEQTSDIML